MNIGTSILYSTHILTQIIFARWVPLCISTHCTDTTSDHKCLRHTGQESGREIGVPEVTSKHSSMGNEVNTSTCGAPKIMCDSASGDICDVVGSEDVTAKEEAVKCEMTKAVKREEMIEEVVLPFELDPGDSHDLLSLSEEIEHLLNPKVCILVHNPLV